MKKRWIAFLLAAFGLFLWIPTVGAIFAAEGEHVLWIDRLELEPALPEQTIALYDWLVKESKKGADSALADVTKAEYWESFGCYGYELAVLENENPLWFIPFPFLPGHRDTVREAIDVYMAESGMAEESQQIVDYAYAIVQAFKQDHPEIFWLGEPYIYYQTTYSRRIWGTIHFSQRIVLCFSDPEKGKDLRQENYRDPVKIREDITKLNEAAEAILADLPEGFRREQLSYLNRWLTTHNAFREGEWQESAAAHNPLTALLGSDAADGPVCDGYARALKILCDRAGIPCILVQGEVRDSPEEEPMGHMWNAVQMEDGAWYAIDVTWNDPVIESDGQRKPGTASGRENEKYFLVGSDTVVYGVRFSDSHIVTNQMTKNGFAFLNEPSLCAQAYAEQIAG